MRAFRKLLRCAVICALSVCVLSQTTALAAEPYAAFENEIPVVCRAVADDADHMYTIFMESQDGAFPPENDILRVKQGETGKFVVNVNEPGTYTYKVYEKPDPVEEGVTYDTKVYDLTLEAVVDLPDNPDKLLCAWYGDETHKPIKISFQDKVEPKPTTTTTTETKDNDVTEKSEDPTTASSDTSTATTVDPNSMIPNYNPDEVTVQGVKDNPNYRLDSAGDNGNSKTSASSSTGDDLPVGIIAGIMAASAIVIVLILVFGKRSGKTGK